MSTASIEVLDCRATSGSSFDVIKTLAHFDLLTMTQKLSTRVVELAMVVCDEVPVTLSDRFSLMNGQLGMSVHFEMTSPLLKDSQLAPVVNEPSDGPFKPFMSLALTTPIDEDMGPPLNFQSVTSEGEPILVNYMLRGRSSISN